MEPLTFHESAPNRCVPNKCGLSIYFDEVTTSSETTVSVVFEVRNVKKILIEAEDSDKLLFLDLSGEVLELKYDDRKLEFLIEWHDFNPLKHFTYHYEVHGDVLFRTL